MHTATVTLTILRNRVYIIYALTYADGVSEVEW